MSAFGQSSIGISHTKPGRGTGDMIYVDEFGREWHSSIWSPHYAELDPYSSVRGVCGDRLFAIDRTFPDKPREKKPKPVSGHRALPDFQRRKY